MTDTNGARQPLLAYNGIFLVPLWYPPFLQEQYGYAILLTILIELLMEVLTVVLTESYLQYQLLTHWSNKVHGGYDIK